MDFENVDKIDFYLSSSEFPDMLNPRKCRILKRLKYKLRDDFALIEVEPSIMYDDKRNGNMELKYLIIASRHVGFSVFSIRKFPMYVYICKLINNSIVYSDIYDLQADDFINIAWGELCSP